MCLTEIHKHLGGVIKNGFTVQCLIHPPSFLHNRDYISKTRPPGDRHETPNMLPTSYYPTTIPRNWGKRAITLYYHQGDPKVNLYSDWRFTCGNTQAVWIRASGNGKVSKNPVKTQSTLIMFAYSAKIEIDLSKKSVSVLAHKKSKPGFVPSR